MQILLKRLSPIMYSNIAIDLTDDCWQYCSFVFMIDPDVAIGRAIGRLEIPCRTSHNPENVCRLFLSSENYIHEFS